jgi:CyaY protein
MALVGAVLHLFLTILSLVENGSTARQARCIASRNHRPNVQLIIAPVIAPGLGSRIVFSKWLFCMVALDNAMTETEFNMKVDSILLSIERSIEKGDADIDFDSSGGILEMSFADGSKIIVNRQMPNREIWVAARSGGYHFAWRDGSWRGTRDGRELFFVLSECASRQSGGVVIITE